METYMVLVQGYAQVLVCDVPDECAAEDRAEQAMRARGIEPTSACCERRVMKGRLAEERSLATVVLNNTEAKEGDHA
jgi:hypothetical protein